MRSIARAVAVSTIVSVLALAAFGGWSLLQDGAGPSAPIASAESHDRSPLHEQMHEMMEAMMGEGSSQRMHAAVPGSEGMMEQCAQHMEQQGSEGHHDMMDGGDMMNGMMRDDVMGEGMDGMMGGGMMDGGMMGR